MPAQNLLPDYFDRHFGISPELIQKVLAEAMSRGGDFADIFFQHAQDVYVGLEDNIVDRAYGNVDLGVGIRVVNGDQTGYAFTEILEAESMLAAARTAAAIANSGAKAGPVSLSPTKTAAFYDTQYDYSALGVEQLVSLLDGLNQRSQAADPLVQKVSLGFACGQNRILVADSDGRVAFDSQPMSRLFLNLVMEKNGVRQSNGHNLSSRLDFSWYDEKRLQNLVDTALERTRVLFDAQKPPAGEMPVVLAAGSSGILLHEAIGHGMEADFNRKGVSIFSDRIGKKVAEPMVTIVDSGVDHGLRGAINIDDEGNAPQATHLVENGILKSYLHDRISAKHYGVEPTGSGRRQSFRHPPLPRMRATYMMPGPHTRDEIIASVKQGIYCTSFTNGQVQIGAGDYTFYVKNGYLIENGKLTAPIKDVNIIGNGPESLARINMVADDFAIDEGGWTCGKDGQSVPVSLGLPTVLVSAITVGGSA
jgi:TldD protein